MENKDTSAAHGDNAAENGYSGCSILQKHCLPQVVLEYKYNSATNLMLKLKDHMNMLNEQATDFADFKQSFTRLLDANMIILHQADSVLGAAREHCVLMSSNLHVARAKLQAKTVLLEHLTKEKQEQQGVITLL